jgi:hypothetical protein
MTGELIEMVQYCRHLCLSIVMSQARVLGEPVLTAFDDSFSGSRVSQRLAVALNIVGKNVSLPINAGNGFWIFYLRCEFGSVVNELHPDIVLGRHWMTYYREHLISEGLVVLNSFQRDEKERDTGEPFIFLTFPTVFISLACRERVHHSKPKGSHLPR